MDSNATEPAPNVSALIIDGAAIVNMTKPKSAQTFEEYAMQKLLPYIKSQLENVERLDVVWDQYLPHSLKEQTRQVRGVGIRRRVLDQTAIPKNWSAFLRNDENKQEMFTFLAQKLANIDVGDKKLFTIYNDKVLTAHECTGSIDGLELCSHEEADTRILLHAAHVVGEGHQSLLFRTVDTDVVVLAVAKVQHLDVMGLWIAFGAGKNFRYISACTIASKLGLEKASALPFFHALTGCYTSSSFAGRGKRQPGMSGQCFQKSHLCLSVLPHVQQLSVMNFWNK